MREHLPLSSAAAPLPRSPLRVVWEADTERELDRSAPPWAERSAVPGRHMVDRS